MTLTEQLRKGLLAKGYKRTDTKSDRECYTKLAPVRNLLTGTISEKPVYVWLGSAGSLRGATVNAFTKSRPMSDKSRQSIIDAGKPETRGNAMLKELEA